MALIVRVQAAEVADQAHSAISAQGERRTWKPAAAAPVSAVAAVVAAAPGSAVGAVVVGQAGEEAVLVAVVAGMEAEADADPICD